MRHQISRDELFRRLVLNGIALILSYVILISKPEKTPRLLSGSLGEWQKALGDFYRDRTRYEDQ